VSNIIGHVYITAYDHRITQMHLARSVSLRNCKIYQLMFKSILLIYFNLHGGIVWTILMAEH